MTRLQARAVGLALLGACLVAPTVQGHAIFVTSRPANGDLVPDAPDRINVTYNEAIREIRAADVVDVNGSSHLQGPARIDADDPRVIHLPTGNLTPGLYTVRWAVASADAHNVSGAFFFVAGETMPDRDRVLDQAGTAEAKGPDVASLDVLLGAATLLAVALLVGVPLADRLAVRRTLGPHPERPRRRLLQGAAAVLVVSAAALAATRALEGSGLPAVWATAAGRSAALQVGAGALALVAVQVLPSAKARDGAVLALGVLAAAGLSQVSHSAALTGAPGYAADLLHVLGAGVWLGGIALLALVAVPAIREGDRRAADRARELVRRVSPTIVAGLGAVVAAGLVLAAWHVPDPASLSGTLYGRVLSVKSVLILGALGLGAFHRIVVHDRLGRGDDPWLDRLRWTLRAEVLLLALAVVASATMTAAPTAVAERQGVPSGTVERTARIHYSGPLGGEQVSTFLDVRLEVTPARPGLNVVDVHVLRDGRPVPDVGNVSIDPLLSKQQVDLPRAKLSPSGPGRWSKVTALPLAGTWSVGVQVSVNGTLEEAAWDVPVRGDAPPDAGLAEGPWAGRLRAGAVLAAAVAGATFVWTRRRDRPGPRPF